MNDLLFSLRKETSKMYGNGEHELPEVIDVQKMVYLYSVVNKVRLKFGGFDKVVYIKIPVHNEESKELVNSRLATEFEILQDLYRNFESTGNIKVVRPILFSENDSALVTEEAPGVTFEQTLGSGLRFIPTRKSFEELNELCVV